MVSVNDHFKACQYCFSKEYNVTNTELAITFSIVNKNVSISYDNIRL